MKLFLAPHNDDETLWGSFTILREQPLVAVVFDGHVQAQRGETAATADERRRETLAAMEILGAAVVFLGFSDGAKVPERARIAARMRGLGHPEQVWAPAKERNGNVQHNLIAELADECFPGRVTHYLTYTEAGKSIGSPVLFEPEWPILKLQALACYESQIRLASGAPHFLREQMEYYA